MTEEDSDFIGHEPCPNCGSSDALARYTDGHGFCFSCQSYEHTDGAEMPPPRQHTTQTMQTFISGEIDDLNKRRINKDTCSKWDYRKGVYNGKPVQVATYKDNEGAIIAQKLRFPNKDFMILGDAANMGLFGQHLWSDGGKMLVVTEGEIDAMSVSQTQQLKWPVVSVPNGAQSAAKSIAKNISYLERFETVVFMFDQDDPGRAAARECAALLSPGKAKVATLPLKDANEMLVANRSADLVKAMWDAKEYRPDGIVGGADLWSYITELDEEEAVEYPFAGITNMTHGLRKGELVTITAGSGIGKSQFCRELCHWLMTQDQTVGYIALEESVRRTALAIVGIELSKPIHISKDELPEEELKGAFDRSVGTDRFFTYDHFGSLDSDNLLNRIRYMVRGCGCQWIFLDHLSIVVSGLEGGDERRLIDATMTKLRSLVEELKIGLILVSHLKTSDGKPFEEGGQISLASLRGSRGIGQLSDIVLGLERNQQDTEERNRTQVRIVKNRWSGETGLCSRLEYNHDTGRMKEIGFPEPILPHEFAN
tara:strand:+ start:1643 stop:3259 length:1617 start_codon:yes stop_codon:yes gene_type:complete